MLFRLFIVSPQAGQNIFRNPAFGEYFRSFAAYGTIAFALIYSTKNMEARGQRSGIQKLSFLKKLSFFRFSMD